jgi:hypothetical protein
VGLNKLNHIYSTEPLTVESLLANNDTKVLDNLSVFGNVLLDGSLGSANQVLKINSFGTGVEWATLDALPSQSLNAGKYLTTDGTTASWATITLSNYALLNAPSFTGTVYSAGNVVSHIDINTPTLNAGNTHKYQLVLSDDGKMIEMNTTTGQSNTLEIPLNSAHAFPIGTQISVLQTGAGQTTVSGAAGVTVNATPGSKLRATWSSASLIKRATNTWTVIGDLTA